MTLKAPSPLECCVFQKPSHTCEPAQQMSFPAALPLRIAVKGVVDNGFQNP